MQDRKCPPGSQQDVFGYCRLLCPVEYPVQCQFACANYQIGCLSLAIDPVFSLASGVAAVATNSFNPPILNLLNGNPISAGACLFQSRKVLFSLKQKEDKAFDISVAVAACLGLPNPKQWVEHKTVFMSVQAAIEQLEHENAPNNRIQDLLNNKAIANALRLRPLTNDEKGSILEALQTPDRTKCGEKMDQVLHAVADQVVMRRKSHKNEMIDDFYNAIAASEVVQQKIPHVAKECFPSDEAKSVADREKLVVTLDRLMIRIVTMAYEALAPDDTGRDIYVHVASLALDVIAIFDPTKVSKLVATAITTTCEKTLVADNGKVEAEENLVALTEKLGLHETGKTWKVTGGSWKTRSDASDSVTFRFTNKHTEAVRASFRSGGLPIHETEWVTIQALNGPDGNEREALEGSTVTVPAGMTATFELVLSRLQGKSFSVERSNSYQCQARNMLKDIPKTSFTFYMPIPPANMKGELEFSANFFAPDCTNPHLQLAGRELTSNTDAFNASNPNVNASSAAN
ncbi:hypothetical protein Poli38472_001932 [Pythium oligandrum]|uniref:Uncharacterized protein n=1 Tax=Pythium oligandrum TaxID=41045 RepID=A0A8K1CWA1_PYTOL|nr:hypothetical protein Poli38472_001932 [Pythium oligandrum]|eukprot:TMW69776.1 hypothetical protein Poli38472_001932 [Pythium oligandrum]